jgi:tetratricopeptide (TPR) repeat protein
LSTASKRALTIAVSTALSLLFAVWLYARIGPGRRAVEIAAPKSGAFHIYVLGGSTAAGVPYDSAWDLGRLTAYLFGGEIGGRAIEVTNLASVGQDTQKALEDARMIARFDHERGSAVAILYSGDNEFLKYSGHPNLTKSERRLFDEPVVPKEEREKILRDYGPKVEEIAHVIARAGVDVIVCTGPINVADREPNRSVLDDPRNEMRMKEILDRAEASFTTGDASKSLDEFRSALAIEPHFAWAHKRAGDMLRALERFDEARGEYQAAVDWDAAPISFMTPLNDALRDVARKLDLPLADLEVSFRTAAPHAMPGYDLFWDNCHPTLEGFVLMASGIAGAIEQRFHVERRVKNPTRASIETAFHIDRAFQADVLHGRGSNLYGLALLTWNPKERLARAHVDLDQAIELAPNDPKIQCTQAVLSLVEHDLATSRKWWKSANAIDPAMVRRRLALSEVVTLLKTVGVEDPSSMFAQ